MAALAVFVGLDSGVVRGGLAAGSCNADSDLEAQERALLELINDYREANGRSPLAVSASLSRAAQWKAQDMGEADYFAHDDVPLGRGWAQRIKDCGYTASGYVGENLAGGWPDAREAFDAWKSSPGHNENMLQADFRAIGIGYAHAAGSTYRWYWATAFGAAVEAAAPSPTATATPTPVPTPTPDTATADNPGAAPVKFIPVKRPRARRSLLRHSVVVAGTARD